MGGESKHEDEEEMDDVVPPMAAGFSTPRRRQQTSDNFEFSVTPEPSRRRLSSSRGRQPPVGLEESPARYSPSKVKAAVRSFADFLHFLVRFKLWRGKISVARGLRAKFCAFLRLWRNRRSASRNTRSCRLLSRDSRSWGLLLSPRRDTSTAGRCGLELELLLLWGRG